MTNLTRRLMLGAAVALAVILSDAPVGAALFRTGATTSSGLPNLTAEITFPGGSPVAGTLIYDIANGTDIGTYVAPTAGFSQHCIRVRNASLANFFLDFRPDTSGGRVEVVHWNGETDPVGLTVASGYTRDLPAYNIVIKNAGTPIYTWSIPFHYWGTRWRYQSAPRAVIRTPAQVFSQNRMFSMSLAAARLSGYSGIIVPSNPPDVPTTNPMTGNPSWSPFDPPSATTGSTTLAANAAAGATVVTLTAALPGTHMSIQCNNGLWQTFFVNSGSTSVTLDHPLLAAANSGNTATASDYDLGILMNNDTGGDRDEEGLITEWQAEYLLRSTDPTRGPISWNNMIQQAEMMAAQWNSHYLSDVATGAPVNFRNDATRWASYTRQYGSAPYGSYYRIQGGPINTVHNFAAGIAEHGANYFYIPFVFTEDPYFIEAMQYAHQDDKGYDIYHKENDIGHLGTDPTGASCICGTRGQWSYMAEPRNIGWGVRNSAVAYASTPNPAPSWMLSQNIYGEAGFNQAKLIDVKLTTSTNTFQTIFHNPCNQDFLQLFETSYFLSGLALADKLGLPTISPLGTGSAPAWSTPSNFFFQQMTDVTAPYATSGAPASFTGSISGNVLTASAVTNTIQVGQLVQGAGVAADTFITSLGTGTGGAGTYNLSASQNVSSEAMTSSGTIGTSGWNTQCPQITNIEYFAFDNVANPNGRYRNYSELWHGSEAPASPTLGSTAGGALAGATYYVKVSYIDMKDTVPVAAPSQINNYQPGETLPSVEASLAVAANHLLTVTSPAQVDAVGLYNVYAGTSPGSEELQTIATFTGTISGIILTASSVTGTIILGQPLNGAGVTPGTVIVSQGSGTGGAGTYGLSISQTVSSPVAMSSASPILIGTNWTMPTTGLQSGSLFPAPPTTSTAGFATLYDQFPTNPPPVYQQFSSSVGNVSVMLAASAVSKSRTVTNAASAFAYLNAMVDNSYPAAYFSTAFEMRLGFDGT